MYVCVCVVAAGGGWFKGGVGDEERLEVTEVLQERSRGGGDGGGVGAGEDFMEPCAVVSFEANINLSLAGGTNH